MNAIEVRIVLCSALVFAACAAVFRLGGEVERRTGLLVAACLALTLIGEMVTGRRTEPVIISDFLFGLGLLALVWTYGRAWLWVLFVLEAALFFMHAFLYQAGRQPGRVYVLANDAIVIAGAAVLLAASLMSWRARRASAAAGALEAPADAALP